MQIIYSFHIYYIGLSITIKYEDFQSDPFDQ